MAEIFGTYQLHEKIAQGGMAEVFLASKQGDIGGFKRRLAIKRVFPHLVDRDEIISMFIDEARIASRLNHPNIVQIYDLGVVDGQFFIAMEYVEGKDLRQICELGVAEQDFLPRHLAVHIVAQVAAGLDYAHRRTDEQGRPMKVIHRDVSPQNVLISLDGAVKLCDFGIAKAESRITETQVGEFKGKFSYMSPEQFGAENLDHRSDIFTLGIVLYETTVAARLFRSKSEYEAMRRITEGDFHRPSEVRSDFPPKLEAIILKALALAPQDRFQSAAALYDALEDWLFEQRVRTGSRQVAAYLRRLTGQNRPEQPGTASGDGHQKALDADAQEPTIQMGLSEEEIQAMEAPSPTAADDFDEPTIQLTMSDDELDQMRQTDQFGEASKLGDIADDASTIQDMDRPQGAQIPAEGRAAAAVEVRRISPEEARRRRLAGDTGMESGDFTTNPIDGDEDATDLDLSPPGEQASPNQVEHSESDRLPGELGDNEPAFPIVDGPSSAGEDESAAASPSSTSSLLGRLPDLRPGGRALTGLTDVDKRSGPGAKPTTALPAVSAKSTESKSQDQGFPLSTALIVVAVGALSAVIAFGLFAVIGDDTQDETTAEQAESAAAGEEPPAAEAGTMVVDEEIRLHLATEPPQARVVVNGVALEGSTPLDISLVDGVDNEIWIFGPRHRPEKLLIPAEGQNLERTVELAQASATDGANLDFRSDPGGAKVRLNGEIVGEAPFRMANIPAEVPVHIQFEKDGHRPYVAFIELGTGDDEILEATLPTADEALVYGRYDYSPRGSQVRRQDELLATTPFERSHKRDEWLELEIQGHRRRTEHHRLRLDEIGGFYLGLELGEQRRATGRMTIDVEPQVAVYVDQRALGASPIEDVEVAAGEQQVVLETVDGQRVRVDLDVEADDHRHYQIRIDDGQATVETTPPE